MIKHFYIKLILIVNVRNLIVTLSQLITDIKILFLIDIKVICIKIENQDKFGHI